MMSNSAVSASNLKDAKVNDPDGRRLGHIEEIVIDVETGRVAYTVLATGGFLGVGDKYFAIPWDMVTVGGDGVVIDADREILANAPGLDKDNWPDPADRGWMVDVYRYYGSEPYWEAGEVTRLEQGVSEDEYLEDEDFELEEVEDLPERVD